MEKLKSVSVRLMVLFTLFFILPLLYILLSERGIINFVFNVDNPMALYNYEIGGILATLVVVPASLKLFKKLFTSKVESEISFVKALDRYFLLSVVRLVALFAVSMYNAVLYYSNPDSNIGILCLCICLISFTLCFPSRNRIEYDLHIEKQ